MLPWIRPIYDTKLSLPYRERLGIKIRIGDIRCADMRYPIFSTLPFSSVLTCCQLQPIAYTNSSPLPMPTPFHYQCQCQFSLPIPTPAHCLFQLDPIANINSSPRTSQIPTPAHKPNANSSPQEYQLQPSRMSTSAHKNIDSSLYWVQASHSSYQISPF